jgi:ribA/ribD-fused uncharacterized protein
MPRLKSQVEVIDSFEGEYRFLSNFWPDTGCTLEHKYQAAKCTNPNEMRAILDAPHPTIAKRLGRRCRSRTDWEIVKKKVMLGLLRKKFAPGTDLAERLLATGDARLIEGNWWHDEFWGVCSCSKHGLGENWLGRLLMQVRRELSAKD